MKLVGPLAACSPGLRLALAHEIERHGSADEILQGRLIDLVAFVDVDGAPGIPLEAVLTGFSLTLHAHMGNTVNTDAH